MVHSVAATSASAELSWRDADPSATNGLSVEFTACTFCLLLIRKNNDSEARVLSTLDVDHDVRFLDFKAFKELDDSALVGCPRQAAKFDATINVVLVDRVTASHVLVFRVV